MGQGNEAYADYDKKGDALYQQMEISADDPTQSKKEMKAQKMKGPKTNIWSTSNTRILLKIMSLTVI